MRALREVRAARGLTQGELALLAEVSVRTVARVEAGLHRPRPRTAGRLAAALGVEPGAVAELAGAGRGARPGGRGGRTGRTGGPACRAADPT